MIPNPERAAALTVAIGWALIDFLWQGLLVGLIVAAMLRALRSRSADLRYGVACAGLLVMAACPPATALRLATSTPSIDAPAGLAARPAPPEASDRPSAPASPAAVAPLREPGGGPGRSGPAVAASPSRWPAWVEARLPMVVALWLAGVAIMAGRLALGLVEVRRLSRGGLTRPDGELREAIARLAERAGLQRPVGWFLTLRVEVPTVVGWLRPTVLIPAASVARLSLRQVEALLAHEIAHIRRHDYAVNLIQAAIEAVLFYHPAVWWVSGRIRDERENACDDAAAALCDGDRLLVARALFAMEEQRSAPGLALAASGGSLKARIRRLVAPSSARSRPAEAGWAVGALLVAASAILASAWLSAPSRAHDEAAGEEAPQDAPESRPVLLIRGRVLDEQGRPVAGARVRLYRRDSRWEHRHPLIKETNSGPDGAFRMVELPNELSMSQSRGLPPYVITADHPGKAVGWATIPIQAKMFEADLVLLPSVERTVRVVDADGRPVSGARVIAYGVGERSSPEARFRDVLDVRPDDGPLTADTDGDGRAVFAQLPNTAVSYVATKPGFAETFAYHDRNLIRLTPGASLSGRVTGPDGKPVSDVKVVLHTDFMWSFELTRTDADGRYRFDDLRAKGWDMSTWTPGETADGSYKLWLDDERVAMPTRSLVLEPNSSQTLDIQAVKPGVIRATVVERGTNRPVAGVRIWGSDAETNGSGRFNAFTDEHGRATFYSVPTTVWLGIASPPDGSYYAAVNEQMDEGMSRSVTFAGGEQDVAFTIPPLLGKLVAVEGEILLPDGSPAAGATVYAMIGDFHISEPKASYHGRRTDSNGRLPIEGLPSGQDVRLYAETADRAFAGDGAFEAPKAPDPSRRVSVRLKRTVAIERVLTGADGKLLASRKFHVQPRSGDKEFSSARREVQSDAEGRIKVDGIVPGLAYGVDEVDEREDRVYISINGRPTEPVMFREVLILAPADGGG